MSVFPLWYILYTECMFGLYVGACAVLATVLCVAKILDTVDTIYVSLTLLEKAECCHKDKKNVFGEICVP